MAITALPACILQCSKNRCHIHSDLVAPPVRSGGQWSSTTVPACDDWLQHVFRELVTLGSMHFCSSSSFLKYLFIFGFTGSLFLLHGLFSSCSVWASHCGGFFYCRARSLGHRGFSICSTWAQQLWLLGSRAHAQQLWRTGLAAPWHVGLLHWQANFLPQSHREACTFVLTWDDTFYVFAEQTLNFFFFYSFGHTTRHVGSQYPHQGLSPCSLYCKCGVLTTGLPGKSC